jgi:midasin (ATPase involved in ribosome maturation)
MAAAKLVGKGKDFIRFNMSSQVTIDDLLGKVILVSRQDGSEDFEFCAQPFTQAFSQGKWLLLDELNLAPDLVLQCIESALDTKVGRTKM